MTSRTEDLEILLAVIDSGSLSAAARNLDIQVARVSRAISRLESELNCSLLNRTTRKLEVTEEGRVFSAKVRESLQVLSEAEEQLKVLQGQPSGRLRVDAATPFMLHQLVPLLQAFNSAYPQIELELVSNENFIDLIEKRTDLAIRIGPLSDSNLHARHLGNSPLMVVASPGYLQQSKAPNNSTELRQHRIIGFSQSPQLNRWPVNCPYAKNNSINVTPSISSSNGEVVRQLCLQGQGLALLSRFMIQQDLENGQLIDAMPGFITSGNQREQINAVYYRNTALSPRIQAFLDFVTPRLVL
ncbi:LysR family transcriptional regulator [Reinekea marinisedimentorum]|uniref:LysR family transcriptional regulator n=1 Tax=Reinekea marinisedimentorum TaxID=230495 RepID=UPI001FB435F9|nr:LysR family transcriptional regulator [Reinekea marinisedimentorum]